jgi:hypothetical protein
VTLGTVPIEEDDLDLTSTLTEIKIHPHFIVNIIEGSFELPYTCVGLAQDRSHLLRCLAEMDMVQPDPRPNYGFVFPHFKRYP